MADGTLRIQVDIHQTQSRAALELLADVGAAVAIARLTDSAPLHGSSPDEPAVGHSEGFTGAGELMAALYRSGFFHAPPVLAVLGKDVEFLQWCRGRENCFACSAIGTEDNPIQAAHYRKVADGAGTGIKPPYSALPLCRKCHGIQTDGGYSEVAPEKQWEKWVAVARQNWGHQQMRDIFDGCESMTEVPVEWVLTWAREYDLMRYIPEGYRVAL